MSTILPLYEIGTKPLASQVNQAMVVPNNLITQIGINNGVPALETNNNAMINGYNSLAMSRLIAFDVSGSANQIILTTNSIYGGIPIQQYQDFLRVGFFVQTTNTGAVTIAIDGLANVDVFGKQGTSLQSGSLTAGSYVELVFDKINVRFKIVQGENLAIKQSQGLSYSVVSSKVNSSGYADFITKIDNNTVGFDVSVPVVCHYPDGTIEENTTMPNITSITTDATYYVIKSKANNPYITVTIPVESYLAPSSPVVDQLWLDISVAPYVPKKYNGTSWTEFQYVKLGEITRTAGVLGTPITYALNGRTFLNPAFPAGLVTTYTYSHNLGTQNFNYVLSAKCLIAQLGYSVGDIVNVGTCFTQNGSTHMNPFAIKLQNTMKIKTGSDGYGGFNFGTGSINTTFTAANWTFYIHCIRNF